MCTTETIRWVKIAMTIAFIAGTVNTVREAGAQDEPKDEKVVEMELEGDFDRRLGEDEGAQEQNDNVTVSMTENIDGTSYSVQMQNGKTTVQKDGKTLGKNRYRIDNGQVEFLDKDGDVEHTMKLPNTARGGQGALNWWQAAPRAPRTPRVPGEPMAPLARVENPPPVMLGITMSDHKDGAKIDSVRDGLPAEKAGLRAGDIIVKIDDKPIEGQASVRSVLKGYKDGDEVSVDLIRDGDGKTIKVTLEAWDAERLGQGGNVLVVPGVPNAPDDLLMLNNENMGGWLRNFTQNFGEDHGETLRSAREALEAALERVEGAKDDLEDLRKAAKDGLEAAIKSLEEAEAAASERHTMRLVVPDGQNGEGAARRFVIPRLLEEERGRARRERDEQGDDLRKQMDELRQQMKELQQQLREDRKRDDR